MKYLLLISLVLLSRATSAEPRTFRDGLYVERPAIEGGTSYRFSDGQFVWENGSLAGGVQPPPRKPPIYRATENGRIQLDGDRVIVLGDNRLFAELFFCRSFDGLTVLLTREAALNEYYDGQLRHGDFYILKEDPKKDYSEWWRDLLKTHPKFKAWINWQDE